MRKICKECKRQVNQLKARGICCVCYKDPVIKARYPKDKKCPGGLGNDISDEELDAMIRERSRNLPSWWWKQPKTAFI